MTYVENEVKKIHSIVIVDFCCYLHIIIRAKQVDHEVDSARARYVCHGFVGLRKYDQHLRREVFCSSHLSLSENS